MIKKQQEYKYIFLHPKKNETFDELEASRNIIREVKEYLKQKVIGEISCVPEDVSEEFFTGIYWRLNFITLNGILKLNYILSEKTEVTLRLFDIINNRGLTNDQNKKKIYSRV